MVLRDFFKDLFSSDGPNHMNHVIEAVESKVTSEMNQNLIRPYTTEEITKALKQMHPAKAPGPDEGFSSLIRQAENREEITGIKVARQAPIISHLFFADDIILFFRACQEEVDTIKNIITQYEGASGQRVNLDKSELSSNGNISREPLSELGDCYKDRWVGSDNPLKPLNCTSRDEAVEKVVDFIDRDTSAWREERVRHCFTTSDVESILAMSLSHRCPTYKLIWNGSKNGKFTVKSTYHGDKAQSTSTFNKRPIRALRGRRCKAKREPARWSRPLPSQAKLNTDTALF
ncbi:hypothetical protein ACS0TY_029328 [Phlomoides rotata]